MVISRWGVKQRWQHLPEWLMLRHHIGLPMEIGSTKTSAWENLGPGNFKDPPLSPTHHHGRPPPTPPPP